LSTLFFLAAAATPAAAQSFDHSGLDGVLHQHAIRGGVDYTSLKAGRSALDTYIAKLGTVSAETFQGWSRDEQLAFLINAYNAIVLQQVIDDYPIRRSARPAALMRPANSVWQIDGFFDKLEHRLLGRGLTLDQIEHEWLRARLKEPRIHFALVCAARSCPPLRNQAYRAEQLDTQLDEQARAFLNDRERNRFTNDSAAVSEIFKWFGEDFGGEPGLRDYLGRYLNPRLATRLREKRYRISYIGYDWTLNDAAQP
jgi:hypothetical protein